MGGGSRFLNLWKCENTRFFLLKHPEMLWNMWHYHLKWKEMLYLANPWCNGSKKILWIRVAEVAREHGWHPPKSLDSDENFKPEHTLFCRKLRFVAIYALFFWRSLGIKSAFLGKNSASWARNTLLHGIYCIFYWVRFENLRLRAKMTHLSRKL